MRAPARRSEPAPIKPKIDKASANDRSLHSIIAADKLAALKLTPVSRETEERLDRYIELLREWQAKTNLVAPSTLPQLWTRHIADSLQLVDSRPVRETLGRPRQRRRLSRNGPRLRHGRDAWRQRPSRRAQSPRRRRFCAKRFASPASPGIVHLAEIGDNVDRITGPVDCVTARAVAPLHQLIGFAEPLMRQGAKALFLEGSRCRG